jgi:glucosamine--fructose-6-phosphate aminotransferase (isomerizing)
MCGIVGYLGFRKAYPVVIKGLQRLEYRGYDSAGVVLTNDNKLNLYKTKGKVSDLKKIAETQNIEGNLALGHTRWATHGIPNNENSHPHISNSGNLVIVHNGIIENYNSLKKELIKRGYTFESETDTEILINLIEEVKAQNNCKLGKAVQLALKNVIGAYAIAVYDRTKSDEIIVARLGSPIAIGVGKDNKEFFCSFRCFTIY